MVHTSDVYGRAESGLMGSSKEGGGMKQLSNDITSSGTVRLNTLMLLLLPVLPQLGIVLTAEQSLLATTVFNIGWKIAQKWLNKVGQKESRPLPSVPKLKL